MLAVLRILRPFLVIRTVRRELHGFCDASERGYGAVIYLRFVTSEGTLVRLLCAKSRVALIKPVTLPCLKLCGAVLLSELIAYVRRVLSDRISLDTIHA